jgi:N-acetylglucosamine-6-phosphate deacetylase
MIEAVVARKESTLVDIHFNGGWLRDHYRVVDFSSPHLCKDDVLALCRQMRSDGVTYFVPTIVTGPLNLRMRNCELLSEVIAEAKSAKLLGTPEENNPGAAILGIHLEGPYLNPKCKGAHDPDKIVSAQAHEFQRVFEIARGEILYMTLSPSFSCAGEFIKELVCDYGVAVSLGHHDPSVEQLERAIVAGASGITHAGNGWPKDGRSFRDSEPQLMQLVEDNLHVMLVPDGEHVSWKFVELVHKIRRASKPSGLIFTSDQSAAAGAPEGAWLNVLNDLRVQVVSSTKEAGKLSTQPLSGSYYNLKQIYDQVRARKNTQGSPLIPTEFVDAAVSENPCRFLEGPLRRLGQWGDLSQKIPGLL